MEDTSSRESPLKRRAIPTAFLADPERFLKEESFFFANSVELFSWKFKNLSDLSIKIPDGYGRIDDEDVNLYDWVDKSTLQVKVGGKKGFPRCLLRVISSFFESEKINFRKARSFDMHWRGVIKPEYVRGRWTISTVGGHEEDVVVEDPNQG